MGQTAALTFNTISGRHFVNLAGVTAELSQRTLSVHVGLISEPERGTEYFAEYG